MQAKKKRGAEGSWKSTVGKVTKSKQQNENKERREKTDIDAGNDTLQTNKKRSSKKAIHHGLGQVWYYDSRWYSGFSLSMKQDTIFCSTTATKILVGLSGLDQPHSNYAREVYGSTRLKKW